MKCYRKPNSGAEGCGTLLGIKEEAEVLAAEFSWVTINGGIIL